MHENLKIIRLESCAALSSAALQEVGGVTFIKVKVREVLCMSEDGLDGQKGEAQKHGEPRPTICGMHVSCVF